MPRRPWFTPVCSAALLAVAVCAASARADNANAERLSPTSLALKNWLAQPRATRGELNDQPFAKADLTMKDAEQARRMFWADHAAEMRETRDNEWKDEAITIGKHTLRLKKRVFGDAPAQGRSLFISMHGGGNAPPAINDQQWENQIQLYTPKEGIYIAPRAPTDTWNLWHESHIDDLFDRLLQDAFALADVNPNRVYIMGYSAGGDGVYQLAPRMADRWAAASMMAGHPNDASPLGLRNLPFAIHVGALDDGYHRNEVAGQWKKLLDDLHTADPLGYTHVVELHPGRGHWMNREDAVAVEWMAGFTRNPIPEKVVWKQAGTTHDRFYWLAVPEKSAKAGSLLVVSRDHQTITVEKAEGVDRLIVMLNDQMVNLDEPITIRQDGHELFKGKATRHLGEIHKTLAERGDQSLVFDAEVAVDLAGKGK